MSAGGSRWVAVIGAGGHAKVVVSALQAAGHNVSAVFDDDPGKLGTSLLGVSVVGGVADLPESGFKTAVIGVGDNSIREKLARQFADIEWLTVIHPSAYVHPSVCVGEGTVIFAGAVIQPDTRLGAHAIINTGATVDHDCVIADYVHLAPGVHLAGGVQVGRGAFMGIGAIALPYKSIGQRAIVGAGGVVSIDLPDGITAVGMPARPVEKRDI